MAHPPALVRGRLICTRVARLVVGVHAREVAALVEPVDAPAELDRQDRENVDHVRGVEVAGDAAHSLGVGEERGAIGLAEAAQVWCDWILNWPYKPNRERILKQFNVRTVTETLDAVYREVLESGAERRTA